MMGNRWIFVLTATLIAQLVVGLVLFTTQDRYQAFTATEPLLTFDPQQIDAIEIADEQQTLYLARSDQQWVLTDYHNFPVAAGRVERLLDQLAALKQGWPVATTQEAARHFKVDSAQFERRITLIHEHNPVKTLFLGTSPGFKKTHVRVADADPIYSGMLNAWETTAAVSDWIEQTILTLDEQAIRRIQLPDCVIERQNETLQLVDQADHETLQPQAITDFVQTIAQLRVDSLTSKTLDPAATPLLEFTVDLDQKEPLIYRLFTTDNDQQFILTRSDWSQAFTIASYTAEPLLNVQRSQFVVKPAANPSSDEAFDATTEQQAPVATPSPSSDTGGDAARVFH
jgi:hypothetical protein